MCRGRAVEHFKLHNHVMIIRFQLRHLSRSKPRQVVPGYVCTASKQASRAWWLMPDWISRFREGGATPAYKMTKSQCACSQLQAG